MTKRRGGAIVLSLAAIMMMGCEKKEDPILDREKARVVISKYLENPQYDVKINIEMETEDNASLIADLVGRYHDKTIAVKYGGEMINAAPIVSPKIDYFLRFPPGKEPFVGSAMESLKDAEFTPVLARREDLGIIDPFQNIRGSFRVRSASKGECEINDEAGISQTVFALGRRSNQTFALPDNSGFGLKEGTYSIVCSFSNEENLSTDNLLVVHFSLSKYELPRYKGGLRDMNCSRQAEKRLDARFTPEGGVLDVVHYRNGKAMESNVFKCDEVGKYAVKAIATDENGFKAESPKVMIRVEDVPKGFFEGEQGGYGQSY